MIHHPDFPPRHRTWLLLAERVLYLSSVRGNYSFETAWGGISNGGSGGGGLSTNFAAPAYQTTAALGYSKRAVPDVSMDADPYTGVSIYDSLDESSNNGSPWSATGGTSVAAPLFAGTVAIAQQ